MNGKQTRSQIMKYLSLRSQMKARLAELKEQRALANDEDNIELADELTEQIESIEWQLECVEDQMLSDYSNH